VWGTGKRREKFQVVATRGTAKGRKKKATEEIRRFRSGGGATWDAFDPIGPSKKEKNPGWEKGALKGRGSKSVGKYDGRKSMCKKKNHGSLAAVKHSKGEKETANFCGKEGFWKCLKQKTRD